MSWNPDLRAGMWVLSVDGQTLGRIARISDEGILVVDGWLRPQGLQVPHDDLCSILKAEIFLRGRLRDYLPHFQPTDVRPPQPKERAGGVGRRLPLLRRNEARW